MRSFEDVLAEFMKDAEFEIIYNMIKSKRMRLENLFNKTDNPNRKRRIMRKIQK